MGMTANYVMVSASELDDVLAGGMKAADAIWRKRADSDCWFSGSTSEEDQFTEAQQFGLHLWIDLYKTYREVHWLLAGDPFPEVGAIKLLPNAHLYAPPKDILSMAMCAQDTVPGTEDFGYGPVRYLTPASVKNIAAALEKTTWSELAKKHDLEVEEGDYIYWGFIKIQHLYLRASKTGDAILQCFV